MRLYAGLEELRVESEFFGKRHIDGVNSSDEDNADAGTSAAAAKSATPTTNTSSGRAGAAKNPRIGFAPVCVTVKLTGCSTWPRRKIP
jgi:hypothetical protein